MSRIEHHYLSILRRLRDEGIHREGRNGGTWSLFGLNLRADLTEGFPLLNSKRIHTKSVFGELAWFLRGGTNVRWLQERGITIWDEWADANGHLGPVYGKQWRWWEGWQSSREDVVVIDQIRRLINGLRTDPYGRRHIVTAWNPAEVDDMALPPCHCLFQFYVRPVKDHSVRLLDCHLYQRSADWFLGVPFNIASYAALTHIIAHQVGLSPGELIISFGDAHLYDSHRDAADEQLARWDSGEADGLALPQLEINVLTSWNQLDLEDFILKGYSPLGPIKAPVSK